MTRQCRSESCFAPEIACNLGDTFDQCSNFIREGQDARDIDVPTLPDGAATPWTGSSLGTIDLSYVAAPFVGIEQQGECHGTGTLTFEVHVGQARSR